MPLILQLRPDVQVEDIRAVLTAVINHHEALRLRITERAGTWEQIVGEPAGVRRIGHRIASRLGSPSPSTQEREAVLGMLKEQISQQDLLSPPLTATYIQGQPGAPCYLAISLHGIVGDNASRDILLTDIFTAFGQQLAGEEIALQPVARRGPSGPSVAPHWQPIPRSLKAVISGCRPRRRTRPRVDRKSPNRQEQTICEIVVDADRRPKPPRSTTPGAGFGCRSRKCCWPR